MKKLISLILAAAILVGCGGTTPNSPSTARTQPSSTDEPLQMIQAESDCWTLQAFFDIAADSEHPRKLVYMRAADNRMKLLGCY